MKSNDNLAVVKTLVDQGAGLDVVSIGELKKALKVKVDPKKIVFASVGKTEEEIAFAVATSILSFNVESVSELDTINRIAKKMRKKVPVALRINPGVSAGTHNFITTGILKNKFGIDLRSTRNLLRAREKYSHVRINGLHIHIGSQIVTAGPFINAIKKVISLLNDLR